jgi:hypothetical protein
MTVGLATGVCLGDHKISSPGFATMVREEDASPESPLGGRFWVLQTSDDEEDGQAEAESPVRDWASMRYGCLTPSSASGRDLAESSTELASRALKRLQRQQVQRLAATAAIELDEGMISPATRPLGKSTTKIKLTLVLETTVF